MMSDRVFLEWVANRFVHIYHESEHVDFVQRLRTMAKYNYQHVTNIPGERVIYTALDGSSREATVQRMVESTVIAIDDKTREEVTFDRSDYKQLIPKHPGDTLRHPQPPGAKVVDITTVLLNVENAARRASLYVFADELSAIRRSHSG